MKIIRIANGPWFEEVTALLKEGKWVSIPVKGKSMEPFIREGDSVMLKPYRRKDIRHGTVVLARVAGGVVLHRVVRHKREELWLAGDANLSQHEHIGFGDVLATAIRHHRGKRSSPMNLRRKRLAGMLWYCLRPARRVMKKIL